MSSPISQTLRILTMMALGLVAMAALQSSGRAGPWMAMLVDTGLFDTGSSEATDDTASPPEDSGGSGGEDTGTSGGSDTGGADLESAFSREVPFFTDSAFSYEIEAPRQFVRHHQLKSGFKKHIEAGTLEWHLAGQRDQRREYDVRRSGRSDIPALSLLQYSIQNEVLWSNDWLETGYQFLGKNNLWEKITKASVQ